MERPFDHVLKGAQAGDERAIAELWREWQPRLLGYLRGLERAAADDLAQETWISVARGISRFEGDAAAFGSWLFTIARRRLLDYRRSALRRPALTEQHCDPVAPSTPENLLVDRKASEDAIAEVGSLLAPDQAEVVLLRVVGQLSVGEVAQVLGKSEGAVRVLQHRGLRRLAESFGDRQTRKSSQEV